MTSTSWNGSDEFWKRAEQSGTRSNDHCAGHEEAGMRNAEIYTWSDDYDAEGMKLPVASTSTSEPKRVDIPSAEIVDIVAGEHAFYALDNLGRIHAWGQLRKGKTLHRTGFSDARKHTDRPILLNFPGPEPTRIQSIKTGGSIMLALDSNAQIWTFTSWGRPYRLISPLLPFSPSSSSSSPSSTSTPQTRIACSSTGKFCLALLPTGSLFIWYPHSSRWSAALEYANCDFEEQIEERDELRCRASNSISNGNGDGVGVVNCWTWEMEMDPDVLPDIPVDLPFLRWEGELGDEGVRLVDVDVGDGFVVGVTNWGHVLLLRVGENGAIGGWRYVSVIIFHIRRNAERSGPI
ncbi:hypothetical protein SISSUDRAFT_782411 [Sistotremastrum suecicum HHB10207 ss-3]|uniref:RCC1/BLIP-II protein n=1 Tax=Sistotremastrum suecicum HHB10207 ss-3 TaxID=1314776 RepID=A0A166D505_9AGAM|nr:hypothetical protein SISSUDRAFT_782411 [Sistotremastrum suecicum HHB10207 ss-3]